MELQTAEVPRGIFCSRENATAARVNAVDREMPTEVKQHFHPITGPIVPDETEPFGEMRRKLVHEWKQDLMKSPCYPDRFHLQAAVIAGWT
jgi:hypothetical protein